MQVHDLSQFSKLRLLRDVNNDFYPDLENGPQPIRVRAFLSLFSKSFQIVVEVGSTESAIISSYPMSVSGISILSNTKHSIKIFGILFSIDSSFRHFEGQFSAINLSISIFGQTTGYRIYTVSRKPIRLLEIQYPVFTI